MRGENDALKGYKGEVIKLIGKIKSRGPSLTLIGRVSGYDDNFITLRPYRHEHENLPPVRRGYIGPKGRKITLRLSNIESIESLVL